MEGCKGVNWIWLQDFGAEEKEEPVLALFRKELEVKQLLQKAVLRISADSRYKLYVNGKLTEVGPSKGDRQVWFLDEVNILPYLHSGKNVLSVQVLRYPLEHMKGNHGIFRTEHPGLYAAGEIVGTDGNCCFISADRSWKAKKDQMFHIKSESDIFAPLQIYESTGGDAKLKGWMNTGYDDSQWDEAYEYPYMCQAVSPGNLQPRTIPYLFRKKRLFKNVVAVRQSVHEIEVWDDFLQKEQALSIPAHTKEIIEFTAGEEKTGYLKLAVCGGTGTAITILQSEAYVQDGHGETPVKRHRDDWKNGYLEGFTDRYQVSGFGEEKTSEEYEPFWFRTFRFIRLEIVTKEEPLLLKKFEYIETGYPLEVKTEVKVSDEKLAPIWDMSERTLRCCMHETYEDCPFYEQLQYAMDSRSQILYTYAVSADDRLARKCMDDFRRSQRYDGLLNCSYPCYGANVIPGFSIYYILMLYDHMMYFGDRDLLEDHMPAAEGILRFFHNNLNDKGYVKRIGGLNGKARFWSFIDWTKEWNETTGVPSAILQGAITIESLLYIMGLQHAAEIAEYLGREGQAKAWRTEVRQVQAAVRAYCTGNDGMLQDGPGVEQYSQQTQVFAILTETVELETGRRNLEQTIAQKDDYAQCSVAMAFYLFRALEKTGLYAKTQEYWKVWTRMLENGATTCVENDVDERSECHAWGSLILYELPSVVLGVQPAKPGYTDVRIHPVPGYLKSAEGSVFTPKGTVKVRWKKETVMELEYEVPENMEVIISEEEDLWKLI